MNWLDNQSQCRIHSFNLRIPGARAIHKSMLNVDLPESHTDYNSVCLRLELNIEMNVKENRNFLKCAIYFKFCVWLFCCLEGTSLPLPAADSFLTFIFQPRCHLLQKASLNSPSVRLTGLHMAHLCWKRQSAIGPEHPRTFFAGNAKNVNPWPLFTHAISQSCVCSKQPWRMT